MLSIIMPVYNTVAFLEETVKSVLAQTYTDFELIMVDDGSTDGSGALCDALATADSRIRVIHKANGGVATARNAGLDAVKGEYIGWVDSDDLISPVMYAAMMAQAEKYGADIVQCSHVRNIEEVTMCQPEQPLEVEVLNNIGSLKRIYRNSYTNALALWSKIYRTELFRDLRFTEGAAFEDDEVVPKLLERGKANVFLELPLYCYVRREHSIITTPKQENIIALTTHLENRMLRFKQLDEELYALSRDHFFHYLKIKLCEVGFCGTAVQKQALELLKKYRRDFWKGANKYDRASLVLLHCGNWGGRIVMEKQFEPVQHMLAKVKRLLRC